MMMMQDKILSSLVAAAVGDAMGAPLATRTHQLIKEDFGGGDWVRSYQDPLPSSLGYDLPKGMVSAGFSSAYVFLQHLLKENGAFSDQIGQEALFDWKNGKQTKLLFERYAGPTTRKRIAILENKYFGDEGRDHLLFECRTATCGAASRGWIAGLLRAEESDAADLGLKIGYVTHDNPISLAGTAAVAAAVCAARKPDATLDRILHAGLSAMESGFEKAKAFCRPSAGASLLRRTQLAIEVGIQTADDPERCICEMNDKIGLGELASESVASAFGFFTAAQGDPMKAILLSINAGNNCNLIAMLSAAIAGAYRQDTDLVADHLQFIETVNGFRLSQAAAAAAECQG